jgi:hypothetical protein
MPGTDLQWDRYIAAYDANETARQAFVDRMRRIDLGEPFDPVEMQRDATELERLFAEMIEAAKPITWTGNGHIDGTPDFESFLIRSHQAPEGSPARWRAAGSATASSRSHGT